MAKFILGLQLMCSHRAQKVEILDWRRIDLCPASLVKIGGHLREVTLYWSGSNPVLRAWSETEGLARLPNLETVNILEVNVSDPVQSQVTSANEDGEGNRVRGQGQGELGNLQDKTVQFMAQRQRQAEDQPADW